MGLRQVFFTIALIAPVVSLAHSQAGGSLQQRIDNNLPQVDERGQRVSGNNPVYIYNNNRDQVGSSAVQSEPTTYVQAAPLSTSRADQMRAARKDMEIKTEEKIVEKLEESRIVDEQRRAERLFGGRMGALHANDSSAWQNSQPSQPVVQQVAPAPAPVVVEEKQQTPAFSNTVVIQSSKDSEVVEEADGSLTVSERNSIKADASEEASDSGLIGQSTTYIAPMFGAVDHSGASNVESNGGFGGALGVLFDSGLAVEGSFLYSNHDGSYNMLSNIGTFTNNVGIDQYNIGGAIKYYVGKSRIRPFIGGVVSYTRRDYTPQNTTLFDDNASNAFDAGLTAGADIAVTKEFSVGVDYRFMQNVSYEYDTDVSDDGSPTPQITTNGIIVQQFNTNGESFENLEDISYHILMLTGKLTF